ncbi:UNKNOWN [Stylonychia lemnae]|uniref:Uncharacterized protein n=1 Tax=Stylonychia lemnae TaxID=5949 RepID=A0A077ZSJ7_STYLE|nr:UNKNOWN [Stylonychia lemnae]|eukprot:CDW72539.1 UNKNOWN [Stylonychia lemnae]
MSNNRQDHTHKTISNINNVGRAESHPNQAGIQLVNQYLKNPKIKNRQQAITRTRQRQGYWRKVNQDRIKVILLSKSIYKHQVTAQGLSPSNRGQISRKSKPIKKADKSTKSLASIDDRQQPNTNAYKKDDYVVCGVCPDVNQCTCGLNGTDNNGNRKRQTQYLKIDDNMRRTIVFEVMVMKESLKSVCERYGVNFSSAKNVIQIYRKEGRLEKKIQKSRKAGAHRGKANGESDYSEYEDDDEDAEYDEDGQKMVTLAPEAQRCKLNLFVQPIEEEEGSIQAKAFFQMNLEQLLQASPELNMDLRTQYQLKSLGQTLSDKIVKIPKNEQFTLQVASFSSAANLTDEDKMVLHQMHDGCQKELSKYHHIYKEQQPVTSKAV